MKIKRFFASDMRQALRQVRDTMGADAVILSNKSVNGGVELVAARDYDASVFSASDTATSTAVPSVSTAADKDREQAPPAPEVEEISKASHAKSNTPAARVQWSQDPALVEMRKEMRALRRMMENELSELTWRDLGQRQPETQELLRRLMDLDLSPDLCRKLASHAQDATQSDQAWQTALSGLAAELPVTEPDLLEQGGVAAVIGPTGVGKTTSVAKLAARFCLRHGKRHLALITTDNFRIGARDQLHDYARILDVPVRVAGNAEELSVSLNAFADKRLVLIDTAGMSQQDMRLGEQLSMLTSGHKPVHCFLALSATTQQSSMMQAIKAFEPARPDACILTKVDETASLGSAFSALIASQIPLVFVTDGQKVPEDIHIARAHSLVTQAVSLNEREDTQDNDYYLAMAFGGVGGGHAHV